MAKDIRYEIGSLLEELMPKFGTVVEFTRDSVTNEHWLIPKGTKAVFLGIDEVKHEEYWYTDYAEYKFKFMTEDGNAFDIYSINLSSGSYAGVYDGLKDYIDSDKSNNKAISDNSELKEISDKINKAMEKFNILDENNSKTIDLVEKYNNSIEANAKKDRWATRLAAAIPLGVIYGILCTVISAASESNHTVLKVIMLLITVAISIGIMLNNNWEIATNTAYKKFKNNLIKALSDTINAEANV